ncbi:sugar ABC transporter permease [Hathewaya histolytica]|uniref:Carbohydrate uptake ABC transporter permease n=1 Tax=Hathewaya histolytica TaxID=1498 RepID=A0A4U9QU13_HATHI|nr:sugar ABC transporter permease [Hathewaya histolytica]VTQ82116.1 carbohydrate uptake ABC transporter permease [Hathewaya histolytica]
MNNKKGYLYLLPSLIIILVFQLYPVIKVLFMSFYTKFDYIKDVVYKRGLDNYKYVLSDKNFYLALKNTFTYVLISVPLTICIALFIASLLNSNIKFKNFFRSVYFLPFVTSTIAISVGWRWIFHSDQGLFNIVLNSIGISSKEFLKDSNYTMPLLVLLNIWKNLGYNVIIILAGMQSIDERYYYAARIDRATKWQIFKSITLPLLSPIILFLSITSIIRGFKLFDSIFILYDKTPGPLNSAMTIVFYIFDKFYLNWQFAVAAAASFVLFIIILIFTLIQFKVSKKFDY